MMKLDSESPGAAHWSRQQYEGLFPAAKNTIPSEPVAWVVENETENARDVVSGEKCKLLAFLVAHRSDAEWELENIAVAETVRRRGVGTLLLRELIAQARAERGRSIFLEVRQSNRSARALYEKAGFVEIGLRNSYYAVPPEDAIIYRFSLN
jgi:ribosomal-protein-alanine acetyltransferase